MVTTIFNTVIAGLFLLVITKILGSRSLYVVAPKLYLNTPLSTGGQIVSLTLINAGLASEEDVAVTFMNACKFDIVATSKSTLTVAGQTISLPKLSRGESVTVLLLVESKAFDPKDIESVESKATKGKVVESKEKVSALWQHLIVWPILLLFFSIPFAIGTAIGADMGMSIFKYASTKWELMGSSKQLAGFTVQTAEQYSNGVLKGAIKDKKLSIDVKELVRRQDVITATLAVTNKTTGIVMMGVDIDGMAGSLGPVDFSDSRQSSVALAPDETRTVTLKAFQPEHTTIHLLKSTFRFEAVAGGDLNVVQLVTLEGS